GLQRRSTDGVHSAPAGFTGLMEHAPSTPALTIFKQAGQRQSWKRAAIQSICFSVIPTCPHQQPY
ncbi:MAG TPA: hypothetical protein VJU54_06660, partial [Nitrospiraceae bacterium]|nr:hypothetical protein [Nitrospiraceae bacterium]